MSAFAGNGRHLASCSLDKTVRLWHATGGECVASLAGHTRGVADVCWSLDSTQLASAGFDGTVRRWSVETSEAAAQYAVSEPSAALPVVLTLKFLVAGAFVRAARLCASRERCRAQTRRCSWPARALATLSRSMRASHNDSCRIVRLPPSTSCTRVCSCRRFLSAFIVGVGVCRCSVELSEHHIASGDAGGALRVWDRRVVGSVRRRRCARRI